MSEGVFIKGIFCDTSFFIRLLSAEDALHQNAKAYFKYYLEQKAVLKISTIVIAEYCVRGKYTDLPLRNLQIIPFNFEHALRAGELSAIWLTRKGQPGLPERSIVLNDIKLMAQADKEEDVDTYITSDSESKKVFDLINNNATVSFKFVDLKDPVNETYSFLPL